MRPSYLVLAVPVWHCPTDCSIPRISIPLRFMNGPLHAVYRSLQSSTIVEIFSAISEDSEQQPGGHRLAKLTCPVEDMVGNGFGCGYVFGRLRTGTPDEGFHYAPQPPSGCNPIQLALGPLAVRPGRDKGRIRSPLDLAQYRVIAAVEHFLHRPAQRGKIFGGDENEGRGAKDVLRSDCARLDHSRLVAGPVRGGPGKGFRGAGSTVPGNQDTRTSHFSAEDRALSIVNHPALPPRPPGPYMR